MLHNICKDRNIQILLEGDEGHGQPPAEDNIQIAGVDDDNGGHAEPLPAGQDRDGLRYRDEFARRYFK